MNGPQGFRALRAASLCWGLMVAVVLALGFTRLSSETLVTDMRALLPQSVTDASAHRALERFVASSGKEVWILVRHPDAPTALRAADALESALAKQDIAVASPMGQTDLRAWEKALAPYRPLFVTDEDRQWLTGASDSQLLGRALRRLYRPFDATSLPVSDDPLGLFENTLASLTKTNRFRLEGRHLVVEDATHPGRAWVVLKAVAREAVSADTERLLTERLDACSDSVKAAFPGSELIYSGIPVMSELAAADAKREASLIGLVSALGIFVLTLLFFGRLRPVLLAAATLALSTAFAFAVVCMLCGSVHLITLVFGATLLGVCVDYVFHFLCGCSDGCAGTQVRRRLLRPLSVSLCSTVAGYAVMSLCPMQGLQQTALFCVSGLSCAFATLFLWIAPRLEAQSPTRFAAAFAGALDRLPRLQGRLQWAAAAGVLLAAALFAGLTLVPQNELALLRSVPPQALAAHQRLTNILHPQSPGQFLILEGDTTEQTVARFAELQRSLQRLKDDKLLTGWVDPMPLWANADVTHAALVQQANRRTLALLANKLGAALPPPSPTLETPNYREWRTLLPEALQRLWLSDTRVIIPLSGVTAASLSALGQLADASSGVQFVNTTADIAHALERLRKELFCALGAALLLVAVLLRVTLGYGWWRRLAPTLAAMTLTLAVSAAMGLPLSLFTVLPLILVLGLGVDYAVVLYSRPQSPSSANSVFLAACSTALAFGLLAFSSMPALHLFGTILLTAIGFVLALTIVLRPTNER
ncbi:MAG: MMPL family transporter [Duodenibacillus sp.]